eukprot:295324-Amphidinium_carterae.1
MACFNLFVVHQSEARLQFLQHSNRAQHQLRQFQKESEMKKWAVLIETSKTLGEPNNNIGWQCPVQHVRIKCTQHCFKDKLKLSCVM